MGDWVLAAFSAVFWGGWMLAWETRRRRAANLEPALLPANIVIWSLGGIWFGLTLAFKSRATQWPLILITIFSFVGAFAVAMLYRRERMKAFDQRQSWQRTAGFIFLTVGLGFLYYRFIR